MTAKLKVVTFGEYIELYKSHLLDDCDRKLTMSAFCRLHGIRLKSIYVWMNRRGITLKTLQAEVNLIKGSNSDDLSQSTPMNLQNEYVKCIELMNGVEITFPDGVLISIKETTPRSLETFINLYNQRQDQSCLL